MREKPGILTLREAVLLAALTMAAAMVFYFVMRGVSALHCLLPG